MEKGREPPKECLTCHCREMCERQMIKLEIARLFITPKMMITLAFVILTIIQMLKG